MIRQAPRLLYRSSIPLHSFPNRRFLAPAPPAKKSRSWKSSAARWGLAVGAVYYYNTSNLFADEPPFSIPPPQNPTEETSLPTLDSIATRPPSKSSPPPPSQNTTTPNGLPSVNQALEATEEEADQQGAFNEETGEINWDCPCLGGMAHGPCGEQFREAFSCFMFSKDEPKGMNCIPNFKNMQDCFRQHPDIYGAELDDDEAPEEGSAALEGGEVPATAVSAEEAPASPLEVPSEPPAGTSTAGDDTRRARAAKEQRETQHPEAISESDELVPKAAHDATSANNGK